MLPVDENKIWVNVRQADTADLLDRVTVYREGMEEAALAIIEAELRRRGVSQEEITAHGQQYGEDVLRAPDGLARQCSFCRRPAVARQWGWHWLWRKVPVFPRVFYFCQEHRQR